MMSLNELDAVPALETPKKAHNGEKGHSKDQGKDEDKKSGSKKGAKEKAIKKVGPQKTDLEPGIHKQIGYVSENGILFPVGWKFKGGHISSKGNIVLNICPKCGSHQYPSQAVKGICEVVHEKKGCGFNKIHELEEYEISNS